MRNNLPDHRRADSQHFSFEKKWTQKTDRKPLGVSCPFLSGCTCEFAKSRWRRGHRSLLDPDGCLILLPGRNLFVIFFLADGPLGNVSLRQIFKEGISKRIFFRFGLRFFIRLFFSGTVLSGGPRYFIAPLPPVIYSITAPPNTSSYPVNCPTLPAN